MVCMASTRERTSCCLMSMCWIGWLRSVFLSAIMLRIANSVRLLILPSCEYRGRMSLEDLPFIRARVDAASALRARLASANLEADRRAFKAKGFTNLVFKKAFVRKMQLYVAVSKQHKCGRRHPGLRHI